MKFNKLKCFSYITATPSKTRATVERENSLITLHFLCVEIARTTFVRIKLYSFASLLHSFASLLHSFARKLYRIAIALYSFALSLYRNVKTRHSFAPSPYSFKPFLNRNVVFRHGFAPSPYSFKPFLNRNVVFRHSFDLTPYRIALLLCGVMPFLHSMFAKLCSAPTKLYSMGFFPHAYRSISMTIYPTLYSITPKQVPACTNRIINFY